MNDINSLKVNKILFISHDGNRAGAQLFLLQVVRYFQEKGLHRGAQVLRGNQEKGI